MTEPLGDAGGGGAEGVERIAGVWNRKGGGVPESKLRMCFKGSQEPSKPQSKRPAGCGKG